MSFANVLILGSGSVATYLASYLQQDNTNSVGKIIVASRSDSAEALANTINLTGVLRIGYSARKIHHIKIDVENTEELVSAINNNGINIVVNATRAMSGIKYGAVGKKIGIPEYGMWTPFSYKLFEKVAEACYQSDLFKIGGLFINTSLPDITIPILIKNDPRFEEFKSQILGSGNIYHLAGRFNTFLREIGLARVAMYGSHCSSRLATSGYYDKHDPSEHMIAILEEYKPERSAWETSRISTKSLKILCAKSTDMTIQPDKYRNQMNASSNYNLIINAVNGSEFNNRYISHSSGFQGRIGGYPIVFKRTNTTPCGLMIPTIHDSIKILGEESIIKVNTESMKFDGIEAIESDKLVFTQELSSKLGKFMGKGNTGLKELKFSDFENYRSKIQKKLEKI